MRLLTYRTADGSCRLGALLSGERVLDLNLAYAGLLQRRGDPKAVELAAALVPADTVDFLRGGERSLAEAAATIADAEGSLAGGELPRGPRGEQALFERQDVRLGPPVPRPPKIICLSHNYWCFIEETGVPVPPEPRIFSKYHNAICGPEDPIIYPRMTKELGYEAELAFVIGKPGRHIPEQKAFDHIAEYTIFNDVSASFPGNQGRGSRSPQPEHQVLGQRGPASGLQHEQARVQHPAAGVVPVPGVRAGTGRHGGYRLPGRSGQVP